MEEIHKRSEEDKTVCQSDREEMRQQVNRLQEEVLTAANANASLEEICKRSEGDKAVCHRDREHMQEQDFVESSRKHQLWDGVGLGVVGEGMRGGGGGGGVAAEQRPPPVRTSDGVTSPTRHVTTCQNANALLAHLHFH